MVSPNFTTGIGNAVTNATDFFNHKDGYTFRHSADQIDLNPAITTGDGYTFTTVSTLLVKLAATAGAVTITGDVTGTSLSSTVVKIHGATVPVAGALTAGNVLQVLGSSVLKYGPINLAGGANFVQGLLPSANQSPQTLGNDLSGSTIAAEVISITGLDGYVNIANTANVFNWAASTTAPGIKQADIATNSAVGKSITISAQNATGTSSTGGNIILSAGTGTSSNGTVGVNNVHTQVAGSAGSLLGYFSFVVNGNTVLIPYYDF